MSGSFQTPDFPLEYGDKLWCRKTLKTVKGSQVNVSVPHMDIEYEKNCNYDKFSISVEAIEYKNITVSVVIHALFDQLKHESYQHVTPKVSVNLPGSMILSTSKLVWHDFST